MGCALLYSPVQCCIDWNRFFCLSLIFPEGIPRGNIPENSYGSAWAACQLGIRRPGALPILLRNTRIIFLIVTCLPSHTSSSPNHPWKEVFFPFSLSTLIFISDMGFGKFSLEWA